MTCKLCKYFVQVSGHSGTCQKKPYALTRNGSVQTIKGKPITFVVYWSHKACNLFAKGGDEERGGRCESSIDKHKSTVYKQYF